MKAYEFITEKWSQKYKNSINCSHPKGFSQRAHCAGKKKHNESVEMEMVCEDCGMCETHGNSMMEVKQRLDPKCWKGKHKEGTKIKGGVRVNNCVPNESVEEGSNQNDQPRAGLPANFANRIMALDFSQRKLFRDYINSFNKIRQASTDLNQMLAGFPKDIINTYQQLTPEQQQSVSLVLEPSWQEERQLELKHKNGVLKKQGVAEELSEEFDLIESIIDDLADRNGVDAEAIWEDLESLTDDELYVFAATQPVMRSITESRGGNYEEMGYKKSNKDKFVLLDRTLDAVILTTNNFAEAKQEAIEWAEYDDIRTEVIQQDIGKRVFVVDGYAGAMKYLDESEAWQKANKKDRTDGMSKKAVKTYRREHPGSKLQTAVTTKPSKLKKGSKASKRRKSYCSRSKGQMKMHNISCAKTPDKAICKARRRWNC